MSATTELLRTPDQIVGPFYPVGKTPVGGDLTQGGKASGTILYLSGRVLNTDGKPQPGAEVEIWQANAKGRYDHVHDTNPAPLDPGFSHFGRLKTDAEGRYAFRTVRPTAYPAAPGRWRPAHIHFKITTAHEQLVTQMYFVGDQYNDSDTWLQSARRKEALIVDPTPAAGKEQGAQEVTFDIVLMRG
jgi:protocatechuate 3,4-dioxygenase, beta subunit